jgi:DNA-directed RNA polymerase alpha subunit
LSRRQSSRTTHRLVRSDFLLASRMFPARIKDALFAAGLKTVGEVREMSDEALLALPDFGKASVGHLRETLGLPSTAGVRPPKKP